MDVVDDWKHVPAAAKEAVLAIGNFDGVHRGHRSVLNIAKAKAVELGTRSGAMIFEPNPRKYFQPHKPLFRLTPLPYKLELFASCGLDFTAVVSFTPEIAGLSAEAFVRTVLKDAFAIRHAVAGFNFYFGKDRSGNPGVLKELGQRYGFGVSIMEPMGEAGEIYSSTRVRELLAQGDVAGAAEVLGHRWKIRGVVEGGAGRGQGLGYPTANIRLDEGVSLMHGIYAVFVYVEGKTLRGASYLGTRPTFDAGLPVLETFLFDFEGDLYGKTMEIEFVDFVREDAKFRSAKALGAQMDVDCAKAKAILEHDEKKASHRVTAAHLM